MSGCNDTENKNIKNEDEILSTFIGPVIPHSEDPQKNSDQEFGRSKIESFGPQLPPHLVKPSVDEKAALKIIIGPSLPSHFQCDEGLLVCTETNNESFDEDYGPLPAGMLKTASAAQIALEERALQMQIDKLKPEKIEPVRESWMTELPETKKAAHLGLVSRQFRNKAGPDLSDRSSWTDIPNHKTPVIKLKKVDLKAEAELEKIRKRNKDYESVSNKHKRKSSKSLVKIHQEKIKNQNVQSSSSERKPFNRETDLQVNKFDEAQRKAVLKKAELLDDRFSSGNSKFL